MELKVKYQELEGKYENLQTEHDRAREETEERTNVRISYIEEEIESMNKRVEKLATDSYAIHSEVREIHESVIEMQGSLRDIVRLYKAILTRYGFGNIPPTTQEAAPGRTAGVEGEPGDDIINTLKREQEARGVRAAGAPPSSKSRTVPPKAAGRPTAPRTAPPAPTTLPSTTNALDELHRLSEAQKASGRDEPEAVAERLATRSSTDDRLGRVARRDMGRGQAIDRAVEGEFTRSLPRKNVGQRQQAPPSAEGGAWEATEPPPGMPDRSGERRPKPRLQDLLSPE